MIRLVETLLDKRPVDPELQARLSDPGAQAARLEREARERADDWAGLSRYRAANASVRRPELVMIGDSLTEIWQLAIPEMFGAAIANRGIAGQTSPQILRRFMQDVVDLEPRAVHILCGTNDIAGNTGPNLPQDYQRNIRAMVQLAAANGIDVLLGSIPPAASIFWQPDAARSNGFPASMRGCTILPPNGSSGSSTIMPRWSTGRAAFRSATRPMACMYRGRPIA